LKALIQKPFGAFVISSINLPSISIVEAGGSYVGVELGSQEFLDSKFYAPLETFFKISVGVLIPKAAIL
jgi:hypothetical protein